MANCITRLVSVWLLVPIALTGCGSTGREVSSSSKGPEPPRAEKKPHATTVHGATLMDDYFWLREKENPKVTEYLKAEDMSDDNPLLLKVNFGAGHGGTSGRYDALHETAFNCISVVAGWS